MEAHFWLEIFKPPLLYFPTLFFSMLGGGILTLKRFRGKVGVVIGQLLLLTAGVSIIVFWFHLIPIIQ